MNRRVQELPAGFFDKGFTVHFLDGSDSIDVEFQSDFLLTVPNEFREFVRSDPNIRINPVATFVNFIDVLAPDRFCEYGSSLRRDCHRLCGAFVVMMPDSFHCFLRKLPLFEHACTDIGVIETEFLPLDCTKRRAAVGFIDGKIALSSNLRHHE